jgi:hypothetical protein
LRKADIDVSDGALEVLQLLVKMIRHKWPLVPILVRADSGFCRNALMSWCEAHGVNYLFGMAKNRRLLKRISRTMKKSRRFGPSRSSLHSVPLPHPKQLVLWSSGRWQSGVPGQGRQSPRGKALSDVSCCERGDHGRLARCRRAARCADRAACIIRIVKTPVTKAGFDAMTFRALASTPR